MKHCVKSGSLFTNSVLSLMIAAGVATLEGCGGGGGGGASTTPTDQQQAQAGGPLLAEGTIPVSGTTDGTSGTSGTTTPTAGITAGSTVPLTETVATVSGYIASTGTLLSGADGASQWRFSSTKALAYSPGSVTTDASGAVLLNFDFGCQTSTIVVRQTDCRNTVSARRLLPAPVSISGKSMLSVDLRNVDASANFAVMIWDATGQVLRYPVTLRGIENRSADAVQRVYIQLNKPSSYWSGANDGQVHGSIAAIAVTAQPFINDFAAGGLNYPAGTLAIGDVRLHAASSFDYTLQTNAQRVASSYTGYKGRLAVSTKSLDRVYLDKAAQAGIFTVRRDLNWAGVERSPGQYNYSYLLTSMPDLTQLGMKVLWILDYGNPLHGGDVPVTAADRQAYADFATATAKAFKGMPVYGYELWNEPDVATYWPSPDAVAFSDLVKRAAAGIKTVDSTAKVVTGGVVQTPDTSYLFKLASQASNLSQVDGIGYHPYRSDSFTYTSPYKRVFNSPESYAADQLVLTRLLNAAGLNKPLWDTESGYSSVDLIDSSVYGNGLDPRAQARQGQLTLRKVLTGLAIDAPMITLYNLFDAGVSATDKELNFGLLAADLGEKPAYVALKTLFNAVGALPFKGYLSDVPPSVHALRWGDATTGRVFVMWADNPDFSAKVTLPAGVKSVKNWLGAAIQPTTSSTGEVSITLSEQNGPVLVFTN